MSATGMPLLVALLRRVGPSSTALREEWRWVILPTGLALAGALLIAAAVIALASRWRRAPRSGSTNASEQLSKFRSLYEKGEMSREEFERIRTRLSDQIRGPAPGTTSAAAPTPPGPTAAPAPIVPSSTPAPPPQPSRDMRPTDETLSEDRPPA
jgi:hypothetical protein